MNLFDLFKQYNVPPEQQLILIDYLFALRVQRLAKECEEMKALVNIKSVTR